MDVWTAIRKNREDGARQLVSEYGDRLFAAAALLCRNDSDAEELVFRTFDQVVRKIAMFEPTGDFFGWLYVIMLNFRRMDLRRRRVELVPLGDALDLPERPDPFVAELFRSSGSDSVRVALASISPLLREVVVLRYFKDATVAEISARLGVGEGTVKSRLFNAREILRGLLSGNERGKRC